MPLQVLKPCVTPGCKNLSPFARCDAHRQAYERNRLKVYDDTKRKDDPALALAKRIRSAKRWRRVELLHKQLYPICCDPFAKHQEGPEPNQESHHIQPLSTHPQLAYELDNLAPLCVHCHRKVEAMERSGRPTQHLFDHGTLPTTS